MPNENQTPELPGPLLDTIDQDWEKSDKAVAKMLAAVLAAKSAKSTRELAHARVRIHEPAITKMLTAGVSQASILECLVNAMPSIPKQDLRAALEAIRFRMIRERKRTDTLVAPHLTEPDPTANKARPVAEKPSELSKPPERAADAKHGKQAHQPPQSIADGSDRLPGESEEDYQLRKSLEPKPDRRKFIGEGD